MNIEDITNNQTALNTLIEAYPSVQMKNYLVNIDQTIYRVNTDGEVFQFIESEDETEQSGWRKLETTLIDFLNNL